MSLHISKLVNININFFLCVCCFHSVEEGAFHQPRKAKGRRGGIDLRQSFVVPQNNNNLIVNVMEPAAFMIPTKEKPSITCANGNKTQQEPTSDGNKLQNNSVRFFLMLFFRNFHIS